MIDVKQHLKRSDPLAHEEGFGLSAGDARTMRRLIVAAVVERTPQPIAASWPRPMVMAAAVAACLMVGINLGLRLDPGPRDATTGSRVEAGGPGARRQLQFVTTGGTRIIWTFHEDFEL